MTPVPATVTAPMAKADAVVDGIKTKPTIDGIKAAFEGIGLNGNGNAKGNGNGNGTSEGPLLTPKATLHKPHGKTFAGQPKLPKLPIPPLADTCKRYLRALEGLQDPSEHGVTRKAVEEFLRPGGEGERMQKELEEYARDKASYIEEFWYESYLSTTDPVVLSLNPYFVLEDDPSPSRGSQLTRAASLIAASLGFIHDLRHEILEPDSFRGRPLDMYQYTRLFGTARIPTQRGCRMDSNEGSRHICVSRRGQIYYFDVLDSQSRPVLTEREILSNLQAICADADSLPLEQVSTNSIGLLTTENRKIWSSLRQTLHEHRRNRMCLKVVDDALFIVCLDDHTPSTTAEMCGNFLCGTYRLEEGVQVGSCTNRWYDKLQIIVCENGAAGINFEHTGVDGHTVLRFAADVYTECLLLLARSINPSAPTLFKVSLSPHAKSYKPKGHHHHLAEEEPEEHIHSTPKKLEWTMTPEVKTGIRFAETRLSDLICQNDCQVLEFRDYGKNFITKYGFSPDAFVQMAFQAAYYGLYGRIETTYEPAMTKAFLHGRTEAIRTVQPESVEFIKTYFSDKHSPWEKIAALRKACENHVRLTKECSVGLGQDRVLYAMYCLLQREIQANENGSGKPGTATKLPSIFTDPGYTVLGTSIISTSNCGNPALRLFGFGPVAADGIGVGYIIKDDMISICAATKHLQTRRWLDTLRSYMLEAQKLIIHIYRAANERAGSFVDHGGVLRDGRTGEPIALSEYSEGRTPYEEHEHEHRSGTATPYEEEALTTGYSFFDSEDVDLLARPRKRSAYGVGRSLLMTEY
ncbi:carnitine acetyl transferase [Dacryopinax primogenitus]|uniref:Carnitine acetyl transferase n=1 Tax=Dacryopinax primogenitus (strain DJM 731) TaxID=1858805 RepID=M5FP90_DACPD|nr:carnitine acetyl transferase [Dacryopinax primogenitus]EJT98335.1 carnitine acetyl transferase [Dacryopinax primogenitus]